MHLPEKIKETMHGKLTAGVLLHQGNAPDHNMTVIFICSFQLVEHQLSHFFV